MDNSAIERIAAPDLGADAKTLLDRFSDNDEVVFFLGRLVWQGEMAECLPDLLKVALDPARGRYARISSIRAVMTIGDADQKNELWSAIAAQDRPLDRRLLAELLEWADPTMQSVELLLRTIEQLESHERFEATGLTRAIHGFIERLPAMANGVPDHPIARLVEGMNAFLDREPYMERGECHVSEEFAWLMAPSIHAVDRLVGTRSEHALKCDAVAILRKVPAVRFWRAGDVSEYRNALVENVPRWQELNDLLYWTSVAERRAHLAKKNERVTDDWQVSFMNPFWKFGRGDFDRCIGWVEEKTELDDRLVALSRCAVLFIQTDRPSDWLERLKAVADAQPELERALEAVLYPKPSAVAEKWDADHRKWEKEHKAREAKEHRDRANWVSALKADPGRIRNPEKLKPGEFSNDQFHLMMSIKDSGVNRDREWGADWQALVPEFGNEVAAAYRDAAIAHWRYYRPELRSEGADTGSTPYSVIFGMAGVAIEATEVDGFPAKLSVDEARHAFRYITWELNGFPSWFEALYRAHPDAGFEAVQKELRWELERSAADTPTHHILHDLLYHAPWLHGPVAPFILEWLSDHDVLPADNFRYCLAILSSGGLPANELARFAESKLAGATLTEQRPRWFALWVDNEPDTAIPELEKELAAMDPGETSAFAQAFIVALLGDRHGSGNRAGAYKTATHLKNLYVLMHRFVKAEDDIERAGKGVYSPTLRDNAQDARNNLFNLLSSVPGPETYAAIKALEEEHPESSYRRWMGKRARERAIQDADEPLWTAEQVRDFAKY